MQRTETADGQFVAGNPLTGQKGSRVSKAWLTAVQEEISGVVEGAGLVLDPANNGQLLEALTLRNPAPAWSDVLTIAASTALVATGVIYLGDTSAGALVWTLPTAVGKKGRQVYCENISGTGNALTVNAVGAETVEGNSGVDLENGMGRTIYSDGANWRILKG